MPASDRVPPAGVSGGDGVGADTIARLLPHRYPHLLVDRVVAFEDGERIVALKNVTVGEPFFAGHFPGRPVMPGVLIFEALTQVGALLAYRSRGGIAPGSILTVTALERVRFRRPVVPGDQLEIEVRALERHPALWRMRGTARVEGVVAAEADFTSREVPPLGGVQEAVAVIHPTAVVAEGARLATDVRVGAYAVIGSQVRIGRGTSVGPHAVIDGHTTIGELNRIFQFASVGAEPQDLKYRGEESRLEIGNRNIIREFATINTGTAGGGTVTVLGDDNLLMNYAHVGHDSHIGSHCVFANSAALAGHVTVEDYAIVGGLAAIHQFVRIGESAILGGGTMVVHDVPPFCSATGDRARLRGLNVVGLKRRGFTAEQVRTIKRAYRLLFASGLSFAEAQARASAELDDSPEVARLLAFIVASKRGITPPARRRGAAGDDEDGGSGS
jgi:UDP-N-acetylglucosamine acyltransferase